MLRWIVTRFALPLSTHLLTEIVEAATPVLLAQLSGADPTPDGSTCAVPTPSKVFATLVVLSSVFWTLALESL